MESGESLGDLEMGLHLTPLPGRQLAIIRGFRILNNMMQIDAQ